MFEGMSDLDSIANVIWFSPTDPLNTFVGEICTFQFGLYQPSHLFLLQSWVNVNLHCIEMWYHVLLWALLSSILIHTMAAFIAFITLRKHRVGR
jgi:hypothetical protein